MSRRRADGRQVPGKHAHARHPANHPAPLEPQAAEHPDYRRYKDRNRVERMFGKLKEQRRIATRYDKTILPFECFLNLATTSD